MAGAPRESCLHVWLTWTNLGETVSSIIGVVLGWLGFLTILYMEIKTVSVTRERDEREKLLAVRAMERTKKLVELEEEEAKVMAPRPYITICGAVVLFVGLFCQLIPFCHLLSELGLPVSACGVRVAWCWRLRLCGCCVRGAGGEVGSGCLNLNLT